MLRTSPSSRRRVMARSAFTLVEILIVVVILGILAAIVVPQWSNASQTTRQNTLRDDLQNLRMQIGLFKAQHREVPPGYSAGQTGPSQANFVAQMTQFTAEDCTPSMVYSASNEFGPYLLRMPENPVTGQGSLLIIEDGQPIPEPSALPVMNGSAPYGWIYKPQTQQIMANVAGSDFNGIPFASY